MAEVLVLTVDGSGNVPPALAIAGELVSRGHRVRVLGHARQEQDVTDRGLDFVAYQHGYSWSGQDRRSSARAAIDFVRLVGDRGFGRDLALAYSDRSADAVLVDAMIPGALMEAQRAGIPAAALMHTFAAFFLTPPMEIAGRIRGFSPRTQWSRARTLVASDRMLDPGARARRAARFVWTGVAEQLPPYAGRRVGAGDAGAPLVLVSLSSVHIPAQRGMFERIIRGLADLPVRVVVTTGPTVDPAELPTLENTEVHRYVPHHEVLPHASLVVGHGGHSTTMRALMHDVPLLVLPADPRIDQGLVGAAVAAAGVGLCLPRSSTPDAIRDAASEILTDRRFADAAAAVGKSLRAADGVRVAADHVEDLARGNEIAVTGVN